MSAGYEPTGCSVHTKRIGHRSWRWKVKGHLGDTVGVGKASSRIEARTKAKEVKTDYVAKMKERIRLLEIEIPKGKPGWQRKATERSKLKRMVTLAAEKVQ